MIHKNYLPEKSFNQLFNPLFSYPDIVFYLLYTTSFVTLEQAKNNRSLDSYSYFSCCWLLSTQWKLYAEEEIVLIVGKVRQSDAITKDPLRPWVLIKCSGAVLVGHCTCMVGLAETCSHVGAILHWVEAAVRIQKNVACT